MIHDKVIFALLRSSVETFKSRTILSCLLQLIKFLSNACVLDLECKEHNYNYFLKAGYVIQ